jgi:hypothetical protein
MTKLSTAQSIAADLTAMERVLLLCIGSDTEWRTAGISPATPQQMMLRGLIERDGSADRFTLTHQGRAVVEVLMMKAATRG